MGVKWLRFNTSVQHLSKIRRPLKYNIQISRELKREKALFV